MKISVVSNGQQYGKIHRQCMDLILRTAREGHATIQVEYVDSNRIRNLESFISKWLKFEEGCIEKSGPYASKAIPDLMEEAQNLLGIGIFVSDESVGSK